MKKTHRLLTFALFASAAAILTIIVCAHQFRWGKYFPVQNVTPEEMVIRLKISNVMSVGTYDSDIDDSDGTGNHHHEIHLETKLGFRYFTKWNQMSWTDYENTNHALILVVLILQEERGLEPNKDFLLIYPVTP
jgi:hypothetical protein